MFTLYLDKRTTDSVAIYLLPQIYCPVEIDGTTSIFGSLIEIDVCYNVYLSVLKEI